MNEIQTIIFSRDRALQLELTIHSLFENCLGLAYTNIKVIYTTSNVRHENSYEVLKKRWQSIDFIKQNNFKQDLLNSINNKKYILFIVDDCIFTKEFELSLCIKALDYTYRLGFSLRLGLNINYCYPVNKPQRLGFYGIDESEQNNYIITWDWRNEQFDFAYPLELSSSLYKVEDIQRLLEELEYESPNRLESHLSVVNYGVFNKSKPLMCSFSQSVAFCAPMNVVQRTYPNRNNGLEKYSPDKLLEIFESGKYIDYKNIKNMKIHSPHQEVNFEFS
jgi:hypothetical protein